MDEHNSSNTVFGSSEKAKGKFSRDPHMEDVHDLIMLVIREMRNRGITYNTITAEDHFYGNFQEFLEKEFDYPDYAKFN